MITFPNTGRGCRRCHFYSSTHNKLFKIHQIKWLKWILLLSLNSFSRELQNGQSFRSPALWCSWSFIWSRCWATWAWLPWLELMLDSTRLCTISSVTWPLLMFAAPLLSHQRWWWTLLWSTILLLSMPVQCNWAVFSPSSSRSVSFMAYDSYVATWSPLHYSTLISKRVCIRLVAVPYVYSFLVALFHTIITFHLT